MLKENRTILLQTDFGSSVGSVNLLALQEEALKIAGVQFLKGIRQN
jgi:hypothetical protein